MRTGNQRMEQMAQSEIRAMTQACARVNGINMAQGVCDTGVPSPVAQAAQRAIDLGVNIYTRYDGLPELRQAIAKMNRTTPTTSARS
ncbi:MAG: aminotransferase class I/II-fold pyridoxal phosphate-dependent enzyme [Nitrospira sp.]|nr:aminotransferase class I/II-fold pyridoxal phosphate-dependent enzyme [Nitrospira sp.]